MTVRTNTWLKDHFLSWDPDEWQRDLIDSLGNTDWTRTVTSWFVSSTHAEADDTNPGTDPDYPLATINGAFGKVLTAGDIVWVLPGHVEDLAAVQIDLDIAGIFVIGVGSGDSRPRIDFNNAAASINIVANTITLAGMRFQPAVTDILIGVDVVAAVTGSRILGNLFMVGEDGAGVDEFILSVDVKAGCDDTHILSNWFYTHTGAMGPTDAIKFTGTSNGCVASNNVIHGTYRTAGITNDTGACVAITILDNEIKVTDGEPGIELVGTTTGIVGRNNIASTGLSVDLMIVAADCEWFENYGVGLDGETGSLIGEPSQDHTQALIDNLLSQYVDVGNVFFVDGGSSGPVVDTGSGLSAADPKQLLQSALDLTVDGNDDFVVVLNYGGNARALEAWPVTLSKSKTHIVGVGNDAQKWPVVSVLDPAAANTADPAILVTGDRSSISGLELGGGATSGAIHVGDAGGTWGVEIHNCYFGVTGDSVGQDGIRVPAGTAAPYLTVWGCRFATFLTRDGIRTIGNATRAILGVADKQANFFYAVPGIVINISAAGTMISCFDNRIKVSNDTIGDAITYNAAATGGFVDGNHAHIGRTQMVNNPYRDLGAVHWGINYVGIVPSFPGLI